MKTKIIHTEAPLQNDEIQGYSGALKQAAVLSQGVRIGSKCGEVTILQKLLGSSYLPKTTLGIAFLLYSLEIVNAADNWLGIGNNDLRTGNVGFQTIPLIIMNVTDWLLGFIGSVSVIMIIYGAVRMGYGAVTGDKETGKKIISAGIIGFVIALSGWFIINFIVENF